jgi:hypothetical protein
VSAIRETLRAYVQHMNAGARECAASLFARPAVRSDDAIRTLAADPLGDDAIEISADGTAATACLHCIVETETAIEPSCPLVEMARAQGGGVTKRSERGVLDAVYVKQDGLWKIERLAFRLA